MPTLVIFLCYDDLNTLTLPNSYNIDYRYSLILNPNVPILFVQCDFNEAILMCLQHLIKIGNALVNFPSFFNFFIYFHLTCLYFLLNKTLIAYSILLMTSQHYWCNAWFSTLDTVLRSETNSVYLRTVKTRLVTFFKFMNVFIHELRKSQDIKVLHFSSFDIKFSGVLLSGLCLRDNGRRKKPQFLQYC